MLSKSMRARSSKLLRIALRRPAARRLPSRVVDPRHRSPGSREHKLRVLAPAACYALTGHSAQGLDARRVILEKDTRSRTTNHRSFYTDLTRAREAAVVVTDSVRRLTQLVRSDLTKSAALDVVGSMGPGAIASEREHG
jgi:hypothetical protein